MVTGLVPDAANWASPMKQQPGTAAAPLEELRKNAPHAVEPVTSTVIHKFLAEDAVALAKSLLGNKNLQLNIGITRDGINLAVSFFILNFLCYTKTINLYFGHWV